MKQSTTDKLMEITGNKYTLSKVVSLRARQLKEEEGITISYLAIEKAAEELKNNEFDYTNKEK